jgi:hypothetical protein
MDKKQKCSGCKKYFDSENLAIFKSVDFWGEIMPENYYQAYCGDCIEKYNTGFINENKLLI